MSVEHGRPGRGRFLRIKAVMGETGLSRTTIWRKVKAGEFPEPVRIGDNAIAWVEQELRDWQEACIAERDQEVVP